MAVNKVVYGNNTLIDLSGDTLAAENMLEGVTGHDKAGNPITGTFSLDTELSAQDTIIAQLQAENTEQKEIITAMEAAIDGKAVGGGGAAVETCVLSLDIYTSGSYNAQFVYTDENGKCVY